MFFTASRDKGCVYLAYESTLSAVPNSDDALVDLLLLRS